MKNLKATRKKKKMSVERLADRSGYAYSTIRAWEAGTRKAGAIAAVKVAGVLGTTVEELMK